MAADEQTDAKPGTKKAAATRATGSGTHGARKRVRATEGQVGQTLRTVYQQTVNEDVPADLLDLLGKLA